MMSFLHPFKPASTGKRKTGGGQRRSIYLTVDKRHCQRQVGVLGRNGKSCPKGKELPALYTCLRVAASAKAGRHLLSYRYFVPKNVTKVTISEIESSS